MEIRIIKYILNLFLMNLIVFAANVGAVIPKVERIVLLAIAESSRSEQLKRMWSGQVGTECNWFGVKCNPSEEYITGLDISYRQMQLLSGQINNLQALATLDLSGNKLEFLPSKLWQLTALTSLNLGANDLKVLPPEIANLTVLTHLNLVNTGLSALPQELYSLTKLEYLDVSFNQLTELSKEIKNLKSLETFNISNNFLREIPIELTENPKLGYIACEAFGFTCQVNFVFRNNCLSALFFGERDELTEEQKKIADWLKLFDNTGAAFDYFGPIRDFCAKPIDKSNQSIVQNTHDGKGIRFIGFSLDARDTFLKDFEHYAIYHIHNGNEAGRRLIEGELKHIDAQSWQVDVSGLSQGDYRIVFSKPDANEPGGIAAVSIGFTKLPPEEAIPVGLNFTGMLLTQLDELTESFGHRVNLDLPVFAGDPTPISEILKIEGLAGLQQTSDGLVLHEGGTSFHARPSLIGKSDTEMPGFEYTDDNLYLLRTANQRLITAAPGLAAAKDFSAYLEKLQLFTDNTSVEGRMTIGSAHDQAKRYFYSAQADAASTPATENMEPGLYFQGVKGLPKVRRAYYVYFDNEQNLRQQAIPSRPCDWENLKYHLESDGGFTGFSIGADGVLTAVKDQQSYVGYADYRVDHYKGKDFAGWSQKYGVFPDVDFNGDSISDIVHIFNHKGDAYIQKIYLFPHSP